MINFGDLAPLAGANITEPVAKGRSIAMQAFKEGLMSIEKNVKEESDAMRAIADELYKSGKVDFLGGDVKNFQNTYKEKKKQLVEALKPFSSVQAFLNNGGYEKIAEFKNELETSDAYVQGVKNKMQYEVIRSLQGKGYSKFKFEEGKGLDKWLAGESTDIGFQGMYNHEEINPEKWILNRQAETDVDYNEEELRQVLTAANYAPQDIESAVAAHKAGNGVFKKEIKDPSWQLKQQQININAAQLQERKEQNDATNAYKQQQLSIAANAKKNREAKWSEFAKQGKINDISFGDSMPTFVQKGVELPAIDGKDSGIKHNILAPGVYYTKNGSKINVDNQPNSVNKIMGFNFDPKTGIFEIDIQVLQKKEGQDVVKVPQKIYQKIDINNPGNRANLLKTVGKGMKDMDLDSDLNLNNNFNSPAITQEQIQQLIEANKQAANAFN